MPKVHNVVGLLVCLAVVGWGDGLVAAPRIDGVSLRGLQIGATTTVVVTGAELMPAPRVWLGRDLVQTVAKEGSTAERAELMIQLPAAMTSTTWSSAGDDSGGANAASRSSGVQSGIRQMRIANEFGISNPVAVVVDDLPESEWAGEISAWPIALSGTCDGATRLVTSLAGKRDQLLAVEVETRRLGSMLNPTIRVLDEQGAQIAWAQADSRLDGDARLVTTLPRDGKYQIELQDALFQGQPPTFFRLKITNEATAVVPFWRAMNIAEVESRGLSALLGGGYDEGWSPILLPRPSAAPTGLLRMYVSPWREVVEEEDALVVGPLPAPVGINGRIGSPGETDKYVVVAPPGKTLRVQCIAERANSPLDGVLAVHAADGNQLATADDQPGTVDPGLEFVMPGEPVTLSLHDLRHRGGEEFRYRLSVIPADEPTLRLTTDAERYLIPSNGVALMRVHADRPVANAAISLSVGPLPGEIVVENGEIPAGANDALVTLRGAGTAASVAWLHGLDASDHSQVAGLAPAGAAARFSPWLANEVAISTAPAAPLALMWSDSSAGDVLTLASNTMLGVQLERANGASGPVRLTLLTTQVPPMRQENNQNVPDVPKTLRMAQEVVVAADQSAAQVSIAAPADLPPIPYDIALQAELLSADGSQVVAMVFSPSRRMSVVRPSFTIELADAATITPGADNQLSVELHGKVVRPEGFLQAVTVQITGLPESAPMPHVIVPEGQTEFTLTATLPGTLTLGELGAAKIAAASELAPGVVVAAANEVSLELRLGIGE